MCAWGEWLVLTTMGSEHISPGTLPAEWPRGSELLFRQYMGTSEAAAPCDKAGTQNWFALLTGVHISLRFLVPAAE